MLPYFYKGKRMTANDMQALADEVQANSIQPGKGYRLNRTSGGTSLIIEDQLSSGGGNGGEPDLSLKLSLQAGFNASAEISSISTTQIGSIEIPMQWLPLAVQAGSQNFPWKLMGSSTEDGLFGMFYPSSWVFRSPSGSAILVNGFNETPIPLTPGTLVYLYSAINSETNEITEITLYFSANGPSAWSGWPNPIVRDSLLKQTGLYTPICLVQIPTVNPFPSEIQTVPISGLYSMPISTIGSTAGFSAQASSQVSAIGMTALFSATATALPSSLNIQGNLSGTIDGSIGLKLPTTTQPIVCQYVNTNLVQQLTIVDGIATTILAPISLGYSV